MSALAIRLLQCQALDAATRAGVVEVFLANFDVGNESSHWLDGHFSRMRNLLVALDGSDVVAFQFYQSRLVEGRLVHHFSVAARRPDSRFRGVQGQFGGLLIRQALLRTPPWRPVYLAGVTNSPRSYANFHAVGGTCFPDVLDPLAPNPFGGWYGRVAAELGMCGLDDKGLLRDRMQQMNISFRSEGSSQHALAPAYDRYVEGDRGHGIFTMIGLVPMRDVPVYLMRRALGIPRWSSLAARKNA